MHWSESDSTEYVEYNEIFHLIQRPMSKFHSDTSAPLEKPIRSKLLVHSLKPRPLLSPWPPVQLFNPCTLSPSFILNVASFDVSVCWINVTSCLESFAEIEMLIEAQPFRRPGCDGWSILQASRHHKWK